MVRRLLLLLGLLSSYLIYFLFTNVMGFGPAIDFTKVSEAAWFGLPNFQSPVFEMNAMLMIAPVAIILVAENLGHFKAVSAMTGKTCLHIWVVVSLLMGVYFIIGFCRRYG